MPFEFIAWKRYLFIHLTVGADKTIKKEFSMKNDLADNESESITKEVMLLTAASTSVAISKFSADLSLLLLFMEL